MGVGLLRSDSALRFHLLDDARVVYAPYAQFEPSSRADKEKVANVLTTASQWRFLHTSPDDLKKKFGTVHMTIYSSPFHLDGDDIKYILHVYFEDMYEDRFDNLPHSWEAHLPLILHYDRPHLKVITLRNNDIYYPQEIEIDLNQHVPEYSRDISSPGPPFTNEDIERFLFPPDDNGKAMQIWISDAQDDILRSYLDGVAGDPGRLSGAYWRMLYFSAVVITTVGFGDIVPMTGLARLIVASEAIFGITMAGLFLTAISARQI